MTDESLEDLLNSILHHPTLESLFLQKNSIKNIDIILNFLKKKPKIKILNLENTFIPFWVAQKAPGHMIIKLSPIQNF